MGNMNNYNTNSETGPVCGGRANYIKIKKNREQKVEVTSLEINNVNMIWV